VEPKIATRPLFVLHLQADILEKFRHFSWRWIQRIIRITFCKNSFQPFVFIKKIYLQKRSRMTNGCINFLFIHVYICTDIYIHPMHAYTYLMKLYVWDSYFILCTSPTRRAVILQTLSAFESFCTSQTNSSQPVVKKPIPSVYSVHGIEGNLKKYIIRKWKNMQLHYPRKACFHNFSHFNLW
jgi:hypothetical protein